MKRGADIARLLTFGMGGHTIYGTGSRCQGYEDPESFCPLYHWWAHPAEQMTSHWSSYEVGADGIPCIDVRAAVESEAGSRWVFRGPMCDVNLADGEADILGEVSPLFAGAVAGNSFGGLLMIHEASKATQARGALDSVSVAEYARGWRDHGARIGRAYRNADGSGRIVWEGGEA